MARIERATSPLPRECSTTEPHGPSTQCRHRPGGGACDHQASADGSTGAGDGNRTRVISLEGWGSTIELLPPGSPPGAFPAGVGYRHQLHVLLRHDLRASLSCLGLRIGGGGWIRTTVGVSQQIYSLPPLATRAPLHAEPAMLAQGVGGTGQDPRVGRRVRAPTSPRGRQVCRKWRPSLMNWRCMSLDGWRVLSARTAAGWRTRLDRRTVAPWRPTAERPEASGGRTDC